MRIALIGAAGMLGRSLGDELDRAGHTVCAFPDESVFDLTNAGDLERLPDDCDVVINAAAWTDVDGAESKEAAALAVNAAGPRRLADWCAARGALFVHYSTDYVFPGTAARPIPVDAATDPVNAYGRTKLAGEVAIRSSGAAHLILRTSWLFAPHGANFVRTILDLARSRDHLDVVDDQRGRPTSTATLAAVTRTLVDREVTGTHHVANQGEATWCDVARAIVDGAGIDCSVEPCTSDRFPRPARRPSYSVLDTSSVEAIAGPLPHWHDALREVLVNLGYAGAVA